MVAKMTVLLLSCSLASRLARGFVPSTMFVARSGRGGGAMTHSTPNTLCAHRRYASSRSGTGQISSSIWQLFSGNKDIPAVSTTANSEEDEAFNYYKEVEGYEEEEEVVVKRKTQLSVDFVMGSTGITNPLQVVKYPHPALRAPNAEIPLEVIRYKPVDLPTHRPMMDRNKKNFDDIAKQRIELEQLCHDMLIAMYKEDGVGLAAPQVGVNKRLMVYNPTGDESRPSEAMILLNPKIIAHSPEKVRGTEGCLSFPGMQGDVERSVWVKVRAMNLRGKIVKRKLQGWEAIIFQHEYDHLDGVVYIDRLDNEDRFRVQPRLSELIKEYGPGGML